MSSLLGLVRRPIVSISAHASVKEATGVMIEKGVSAVLVLEGGRAKGICTERDLVLKVVREGRDPRRTAVSITMTTPVIVVRQDAKPPEALSLMLDRKIRHLPVVDECGEVIGMLSLRHLMHHQIERLSQDVNALNNYAGAGGIGGD